MTLELLNGGIVILLVEDDEGDAILVRDAVDRVIHHVKWNHVKSKDEAKEWLKGGKPTLVLLDKKLTGSGPYEALEEIDQLTDAPIMIITGHDDPQEAFECTRRGADAFLSKNKLDEEVTERRLNECLGKLQHCIDKKRLRAASLIRESEVVEASLVTLKRGMKEIVANAPKQPSQ